MAVGLALIMTAGLSACGDRTNGSNGNMGSSGNRGTSSANAQLAKENVYQMKEFDFPKFVDPENGYTNVYAVEYREDKVYVVVEANDWSKNEAVVDVNLIVVNEDGSNLQTIKLDTSDGEEASEEGAAQDSSEGDSGASDGEISDIWENTSFGNFTISFDGKIFGTKFYNFEDYTNQEQVVRENRTYVCCWDTDGSRLWETEVEGLRSDEEGAEWLYVSALIAGEDGSAKLLLNGDNMYRMDVGSDGTLSEREKLSEETGQVLNYHQYALARQDGTMLVIYSDENDWTKCYMASYDPETDTLGEPAEMPVSFSMYGYGNMSTGMESDLVFSMNDGIYIYNQGDENVTKKMDFVNSDVNISNFLGLIELNQDSFIGIYNENYGEDIKAALFTYRDPADIPDKAVVVLAGNWVGSDIRQRVVEFNRESDAYRIVLKEYNSYNTFDDYQAGYTQLNNDIITCL